MVLINKSVFYIISSYFCDSMPKKKAIDADAQKVRWHLEHRSCISHAVKANRKKHTEQLNHQIEFLVSILLIL